MEEEEEEITNLTKTPSTTTLESVSRNTSSSTLIAENSESSGMPQQQVGNEASSTGQSLSRSTSSSTLVAEPTLSVTPQCQIVTQQASGDSMESESESISFRVSPRYSLLTTPHSSSSQEEYEVPVTRNQFLTAGHRVEARSMESLKTHSKSFLSTSERDVRKFYAESTEAKSLESFDREMVLKRHAISGEGSLLMGSSQEMSAELRDISAEKRRGWWSGKLRVPQHLSLPPSGGYLSAISPGDRRLTILSPHSPHRTPDFISFTQQSTLKSRRKKATILPRLVLPRSDSDISEVFSEHGLEKFTSAGNPPAPKDEIAGNHIHGNGGIEGGAEDRNDSYTPSPELIYSGTPSPEPADFMSELSNATSYSRSRSETTPLYLAKLHHPQKPPLRQNSSVSSSRFSIYSREPSVDVSNESRPSVTSLSSYSTSSRRYEIIGQRSMDSRASVTSLWSTDLSSRRDSEAIPEDEIDTSDSTRASFASAGSLMSSDTGRRYSEAREAKRRRSSVRAAQVRRFVRRAPLSYDRRRTTGRLAKA